jgi:hypothetical protein
MELSCFKLKKARIMQSKTANKNWDELIENADLFSENILSKMTGWLDVFAAKRTLDLLAFQEKNEIRGSLYEIGVFRGKYFAILARSGAITGDTVVGIDCFDFIGETEFRALFEDQFGYSELVKLKGADIRIINSRSNELTPARLRALLNSEARFISIDGSHEYIDVIGDLQTAEKVISPAGIISADDYLNPICLGVTAAIDKFLVENETLVPFGYICNKLFICRSPYADRYRTELEKCIIADSSPKGLLFRDMAVNGHRRNIEATYRNYRILTVRL